MIPGLPPSLIVTTNWLDNWTTLVLICNQLLILLCSLRISAYSHGVLHVKGSSIYTYLSAICYFCLQQNSHDHLHHSNGCLRFFFYTCYYILPINHLAHPPPLRAFLLAILASLFPQFPIPPFFIFNWLSFVNPVGIHYHVLPFVSISLALFGSASEPQPSCSYSIVSP